MSLTWAIVLVLVADVLAIGAMLLVRRRAPDGSYFQDGDRASGVFGVLATGFSVLLGFVVFLAFTSYDDSSSASEEEALAVGQQFETAQFLPAAVGGRAADHLICYARSVVHQEWPRLASGTTDDTINPWGVALFRDLQAVQLTNPVEEAAFAKWLDETSEREAARIDRIHASDGVIPGVLWVVLVLIGVVILFYMLFFADSGEGPVVQATLMGAVVTVLLATMILILFLDSPYDPDLGNLQPTAMQRTIGIIEQARAAIGVTGPVPCDAAGLPLSAG